MDQRECKELIDCSQKIYQATSSVKDKISEENITRKFAFHSVVSKRLLNKMIY